MAKGRRDYTPEISSPIESQFILEDEVEVAKSPVQRESFQVPEYYYEPPPPNRPLHPSAQPAASILSPQPISNSASSRSFAQHDVPYIPDNQGGFSTLQPNPSVSSLPYDHADKESYPNLYTAATGVGLGFGRPPDSNLDPADKYLSPNEGYALKERQVYRAGSPVVPILEKFEPEAPSLGNGEESGNFYSRPSFAGSRPDFNQYGSRATSIASGKTGHGSRMNRSMVSSIRNAEKRKQQKRKRSIIIAIVAATVILAMAIPVGYVMSKRDQMPSEDKSASISRGNTTGTAAGPQTTQSPYNDPNSSLNPLAVPQDLTVQSGANGDTVNTYVNGEAVSFTYVNDYGGSFYYNPTDPFSRGGQAQSWSPAIGEEWTWGTDLARGVNLGGWLVTEPFIAPALFESTATGSVDEWTLCEKLRAFSNASLEQTFRDHYETFIVEEDFAMIAGAGLNYLRIPIGYWAVSKMPSEPYLEKVSWEYFVRALGWARKYGLRVVVDLHGLPGSQNGWNHSGKSGVVNWMYGVLGISNAQRTLETLRSITEFVSQDQYKDVVTMVGLVNEVQNAVIGLNNILSFYYTAYNMIRGITGVGSGKGPIVLVHDAFAGIAAFNDFMPGADRLALDQHPYRAFIDPSEMNIGWEAQYRAVCSWGGGTNDTRNSNAIVIGGEFSAAINDCGKWLTGVGGTATYESTGQGSCSQWNNWASWSDDLKANISTMVLAEMDALQEYMFWTWKIGNSTTLGSSSSPFWHYKLGLQQGWIPRDPRMAAGTCARFGVGGNSFAGSFPASATGGGNGVIATAAIGNYSAFPPATLGPTPSFEAPQIALMPTFTQTGTPVTLTQASYPTGVNAGNGWANNEDTIGAWVEVTGCAYPDFFNATARDLLPTAACGGIGPRTVTPTPTPTS